MSDKYPDLGNYLEINKKCFKATNKFSSIRLIEPEGAYLPKMRVSHFSKPTYQSRIAFNLRINSPLFSEGSDGNTVYNSPLEMMRIFHEKEIIECIRVMKSSKLKILKAKIDLDLCILAQKHKDLMHYEDNYDDFLMFEINDFKFMTELIERVYQNNLKADDGEGQNILMFFEKPMLQVAAATRIQCAYRLYSWRKQQEVTPLTKILRRRGAVCIQRGWRKWVLTHRLNALSRIKQITDQIDQPHFYLETNVYANMRKIIDSDINRWRFEEQ